MRINNFFLNNPTFIDENFLKQGSIFKGKILEIFNEEVLMEIKDQGTLRAVLDTKIEISINDEITFLVKSSREDKIEIKPIIINNLDESTIEKANLKDSLISKVLANIKNLNIKDNTLSFELAKNLMENNIHLSEENLINSIKILDKLIDLSNLQEGKKVIFLEGKSNSEKNINSKMNLEIEIDKNQEINLKTLDEKEPEILMPHKVNIKHLLITDKDSHTNKDDLSSVVKEFLFNNEPFKPEEFPKIIGFLMKNDIEASLNNINKIRELSNNPEKFLKDFLITKENFKELIKNNIDKKDFMNRIEILQENSDKKLLEINSFKELEKISEEIKNFKSHDTEGRINSFNDKIDFLKELNKNLSFMFIPINYKPGDLEGIVSFLKRKNKNTKSGKINVFINLDTKSLGNVKVSCELYMKNINVKMNVDQKDLNLFQSKENLLIEKIKSIGYNLNKVDYVFNEKLKLIDQVVVNENPTYFLDIKV